MPARTKPWEGRWDYNLRERAWLLLAAFLERLARGAKACRDRVSASVIRRRTPPCDECGSREPVGSWVSLRTTDDGETVPARGCWRHTK